MYCHTLSLHDALPITSSPISALRACASASASTTMPTTSMPCCSASRRCSGLYGLFGGGRAVERQDDGHAPGALLRLEAAVEGQLADRSEEHTSELQSLMRISYAVFCLKKKKKN